MLANSATGISSSRTDWGYSHSDLCLLGVVLEPGDTTVSPLYETDSKTTIVVYATLGPTANADTNNAVPIGNDIGAMLLPDNPPKVA